MLHPETATQIESHLTEGAILPAHLLRLLHEKSRVNRGSIFIGGRPLSQLYEELRPALEKTETQMQFPKIYHSLLSLKESGYL